MNWNSLSKQLPQDGEESYTFRALNNYTHCPLLVVSAVQGNLAQPSAIKPEMSGKLNLIFVSTKSIVGEYYGTNGLAIRFISDEERISITTFTYNTTSDSSEVEEPILLLERPQYLETRG